MNPSSPATKTAAATHAETITLIDIGAPPSPFTRHKNPMIIVSAGPGSFLWKVAASTKHAPAAIISNSLEDCAPMVPSAGRADIAFHVGDAWACQRLLEGSTGVASPKGACIRSNDAPLAKLVEIAKCPRPWLAHSLDTMPESLATRSCPEGRKYLSRSPPRSRPILCFHQHRGLFLHFTILFFSGIPRSVP